MFRAITKAATTSLCLVALTPLASAQTLRTASLCQIRPSLNATNPATPPAVVINLGPTIQPPLRPMRAMRTVRPVCQPIRRSFRQTTCRTNCKRCPRAEAPRLWQDNPSKMGKRQQPQVPPRKHLRPRHRCPSQKRRCRQSAAMTMVLTPNGVL